MLFSIKSALSILSVVSFLSSAASAMDISHLADETLEEIFHHLPNSAQDPALRNAALTCRRFKTTVNEVSKDETQRKFHLIEFGISKISADLKEPNMTLDDILNRSATANSILNGTPWSSISPELNIQLLKNRLQIAKELEDSWRDPSLENTQFGYEVVTTYKAQCCTHGVKSATILFVAAQLGDPKAISTLSNFTVFGSRKDPRFPLPQDIWMNLDTSQLVLSSLIRRNKLYTDDSFENITGDINSALEEIQFDRPRSFLGAFNQEDLLALQRMIQESGGTAPAAAPVALHQDQTNQGA